MMRLQNSAARDRRSETSLPCDCMHVHGTILARSLPLGCVGEPGVAIVPRLRGVGGVQLLVCLRQGCDTPAEAKQFHHSHAHRLDDMRCVWVVVNMLPPPPLFPLCRTGGFYPVINVADGPEPLMCTFSVASDLIAVRPL